MPRSVHWLGLVALLAVLPALGGCLGKGTVEVTRLYLLEGLPRPGTGGTVLPSIGLDPVILPDYADRPQLVIRSARNELELAPFARWGAPLQEQVAGVLADNLSALLRTDRVTAFPWEGPDDVEYRVAVVVERLESDRSGNAVLWARWSILHGEENATAASGRSEITDRADGNGYVSLVAAHSRTLQALSREIAAALQHEIRRTQEPIERLF